MVNLDNRSSISMFKTNVHEYSEAIYYFEEGAINFFNSKILKVYADDKNTYFVALEKVSYNNIKNEYKVLYLNIDKREFLSSDILEDKDEAEYIFNDIRNTNTLNLDKYNTIIRKDNNNLISLKSRINKNYEDDKTKENVFNDLKELYEEDTIDVRFEIEHKKKYYIVSCEKPKSLNIVVYLARYIFFKEAIKTNLLNKYQYTKFIKEEGQINFYLNEHYKLIKNVKIREVRK